MIGSSSSSTPASLAFWTRKLPHQARASFTGRAVLDSGSDQLDCAGVDEIAHHLVGNTPLLLNFPCAAATVARGWSGAIGRPTRGWARPAPSPAPGNSGSPRRSPWCGRAGVPVLVEVPGFLRDPASGGQNGALPLHFVADGDLDAFQRVDVLGLGAGAELVPPWASATRWRHSASSPGPSGRRKRPTRATGLATRSHRRRAT